MCNGGVATELAVIYMVNAGCGEYAVDFRQHPTASWLVAAVLGAISCSCGDTFASEIGSAVGSWSPRLITNLQPVPKGLLPQLQHFVYLLQYYFFLCPDVTGYFNVGKCEFEFDNVGTSDVFNRFKICGMY